MEQQLKILSATVGVLVLLSSIAVSSSTGAGYTASSYPTTAVGTSSLGNGTFATEAGKVECETHYEISFSGILFTGILKSKFTKCKAFGFLEATGNEGSCKYELLEPSGSGDNYAAPVRIVCSEGSSPIRITASTCEVTVGGQSPTGSVALTNDTASGDLTLKANVTGIQYTVTKDGIGCPFAGTGAKTGATFVHDSAVTLDTTNGASIDVG